jgi:hypothetical protein
MSYDESEAKGATNDHFDGVFARTTQLMAEGFEHSHAFGLAYLEERVALWPKDWGEALQILIYGDFAAPENDLHFDDLGITIHHEPKKNTAITGTCVLGATVLVQERTISGVVDAVKRINILLGAWLLVEWGNGSPHWWCYITHHYGSGAAFSRFSADEWRTAVGSIMGLPTDARKKLEAALYWIRESGRSFRVVSDGNPGDLLRKFSAYWNAFECVVEAINVIRPPKKMSKSEKQRKINEFAAARGGVLTASDIDSLYKEVVNPGLVSKAEHALRICFGNDAAVYMEECFLRKDRKNRLYDVRNAINHGDIDAESPEDLPRIAARLGRLQIILFGMLGRLVRFRFPLDETLATKPSN